MDASFKNFSDLRKHFNNELTCFQYLEHERWAGTPICPHCGSEHHTRVKTRLKHPDLKDYKDFRCKACMKKYTTLTGTIFQSSKISLQTWFQVLYLFITHKKGISSYQIAEDFGLTQKSAWFMAHRIRQMCEEKTKAQLKGIVSVDESYVGGKSKNKHKNKRIPHNQGRRAAGKIPVIGMLERDGKVRTFVSNDVSSKTLHDMVNANVEPWSILITDSFRGYSGLEKNYFRIMVKHQESNTGYVIGGFSTNNIENYWSIFKRSIIGIYHQVSAKHLQKYCNEHQWRFNHRKIPPKERIAKVLRLCNDTWLPYKELIAA